MNWFSLFRYILVKNCDDRLLIGSLRCVGCFIKCLCGGMCFNIVGLFKYVKLVCGLCIRMRVVNVCQNGLGIFVSSRFSRICLFMLMKKLVKLYFRQCVGCDQFCVIECIFVLRCWVVYSVLWFLMQVQELVMNDCLKYGLIWLYRR